MKRRMDRGEGTGSGLPGALCLIAALLVLGGCDQEEAEVKPLPAEKAAYVGIWENGRYGESDPYVYLQISEDGYFAYARNDTTGIGSSCMVVDKAPLGSITDARISVPLFWDFTIDFEVNEPPRESGRATHMTVDGDTLRRTDSRSGGFDYEWECNDGAFGRRRVG